MGVKISEIIPREKLTFEQLEGKKIAIDFSHAAYQFLSSIRQQNGTPLMDSQGNVTSHLQGILSRSVNLLAQGMKLAYVFDGAPPALKIGTQSDRHEKKILAEEKHAQATEEGDEELMLRYAKQTVRLTKQMTAESKELIQALGMPIVQAPCEADAQIAYHCKQGDAWAAGTSDFDFLLHGCPRVVLNLTLAQKRRLPTGAMVKVFPEMISLEKTLEVLEISHEQLLALGVLVGTDYNKGVFRVGQKKALKIVKELKTPKKIFQEHKIEDVSWEEVFEQFKKMPVDKKVTLEWAMPDQEKVLRLLVDKHEFSEQRVLGTLNKLTTTRPTGQKGLDAWMG